MQILQYLRGSIPLLTFALGITAWMFLPSLVAALDFQAMSEVEIGEISR